MSLPLFFSSPSLSFLSSLPLKIESISFVTSGSALLSAVRALQDKIVSLEAALTAARAAGHETLLKWEAESRARARDAARHAEELRTRDDAHAAALAGAEAALAAVRTSSEAALSGARGACEARCAVLARAVEEASAERLALVSVAAAARAADAERIGALQREAARGEAAERDAAGARGVAAAASARAAAAEARGEDADARTAAAEARAAAAEAYAAAAEARAVAAEARTAAAEACAAGAEKRAAGAEARARAAEAAGVNAAAMGLTAAAAVASAAAQAPVQPAAGMSQGVQASLEDALEAARRAVGGLRGLEGSMAALARGRVAAAGGVAARHGQAAAPPPPHRAAGGSCSASAASGGSGGGGAELFIPPGRAGPSHNALARVQQHDFVRAHANLAPLLRGQRAVVRGGGHPAAGRGGPLSAVPPTALNAALARAALVHK